MTYRERLLEKVRGFNKNLRDAESIKAKGDCAAGVRAYVKDVGDMLPLLTALLDENAKLVEAMEFYVKSWPNGIIPGSLMAENALTAHATAMEKLCGEEE